MDRIEFENMVLDDQLEYINTQAAIGMTITKICANMRLGKTTLKEIFKGYTYNRTTKQYESNINDPKSIANVIIPHGNNNSDLKDWIDNKKDILELLKSYKHNQSIKQLDISTLPVGLQYDIITKSIKLYNPVYEAFDELCKGLYSSIKKQDILSLALYEFTQKYKKE